MKTGRNTDNPKDSMGKSARKSRLFDIFAFSTYPKGRIFAILLAFYDILVVNAAYFLILWLRYDCRFSMIEERYISAWIHFIPIYTVFCIAVFWILRLYKSQNQP